MHKYTNNRGMSKKVKISDIAEALGISKNTVSKALNGQYVPEKTRNLVLSKARELNYKSMMYIDGEVIKNHRILLLSTKPLSNMNYFLPIIQTIENICYEKKYQLFQHVALEDEFYSKSFELYLENVQIDGIVVIESFQNKIIKKILDKGIPTVFIDFSVEHVEHTHPYDVIEPDNFNVIFNYLNKKIQKEKIKDINFIGDHNHCLSFKERYLAMHVAISTNNINHDFSKDLTDIDDSSIYGNPLLLKNELLRKGLSPFYVCGNDYIALNLIKALKLMKKNVPNDVQVMGFDNSMESRTLDPKITTINVQTEHLAKITLDCLIDRINNPNKCTTKVLVNSDLIIRESTE